MSSPADFQMLVYVGPRGLEDNVREKNLYEEACQILDRIRTDPAENEDIAREERQEVASLLEKDIRDQLIFIRSGKDRRSFEKQIKPIQTSLELLESLNTLEARQSLTRLCNETCLISYWAVLHDDQSFANRKQ